MIAGLKTERTYEISRASAFPRFDRFARMTMACRRWPPQGFDMRTRSLMIWRFLDLPDHRRNRVRAPILAYRRRS